MAISINSPHGATNATVQGAVKPGFGEVKIRDRGRLPHWEMEAGLYFVTFRLADSLPKAVLDKIAERHRILAAAERCGANLLPEHKVLIDEYSPTRIEEYTDRGNWACFLKDCRIAATVADALRFWNGKRYRLLAWCVMPNHVHVILRMLPGQELANVLLSWKSYTAKMANRLLVRTGPFWQREYYDRLLRDGNELDRARRYIASNPERAGLTAWRWIWDAEADVRGTAFAETGHLTDSRTEAGNRQ